MNRQLGVVDYKCVGEIYPIRSGHVIRRMRSSQKCYVNGILWKTLGLITQERIGIGVVFWGHEKGKLKNTRQWYFTHLPRRPQWGDHFYRAMLCVRGTSHSPVSVCLSVRPSVCLSVTSRCSTKTAKRRIIQTTPHDSPVTLVYWCQRSPRNSTGVTPYEGAECRWGGSKSATFDQ